MDWDKASAELGKPLDKKHVRSAKDVRGQFIEGWHAINEANRIFGFNGWSYAVDTLTETWRGEVTLKGKNGEEYQQARAAYMAIVTVTVGGVARQDVGNGSGSGHPYTWGNVIESAQKEAVTDALKRALRTFGNPFGLALYDPSKANVGTPEPESAPPMLKNMDTGKATITTEQLDRLNDLIEQLGPERGAQVEKEIMRWKNIKMMDHLPERVFQVCEERLLAMLKEQEAADAA